MKATQHSPLPWVQDGCVVEAFDAPFHHDIAATSKSAIWTSDESRAEANAKFIVKACNCHDELLAALKDLLNATSGNPKTPPTGFEAIRARAAIAKAEGE